ncbi:LuxR C-terminal-related transcriptional regulator [Streptomyces sp. SBC-4]|nr:LuxR C-terminal-related transcriptional regulator [Streptomyces sp. SBC-4]MDV5148790.1 LuxR C-terminal-related transcriptional regulator [Streptomyces sp. SBC-4]
MAFVVELVFRGNESDRSRFGQAHRTYWKRMAARGILLGGGPWRDGTGELLLCEAHDRRTLLRVLHADPYARAHVVGEPRIREWNALPGHMAPARPERSLPASVAVLTAHERRIATMMLDGLTNKQIAETFTVSTRAVELHITRIYRKLDIRRRAQLAAVIGRGVPRGSAK